MSRFEMGRKYARREVSFDVLKREARELRPSSHHIALREAKTLEERNAISDEHLWNSALSIILRGVGHEPGTIEEIDHLEDLGWISGEEADQLWDEVRREAEDPQA